MRRTWRFFPSFQKRILFALSKNPHLGGQCFFTISKRDPLLQELDLLRRRMETDLQLIRLWDLESRIRHSLAKVGIVRQEKQAGCIHVEASDGKEPLPAFPEKIIDGLTIIRVSMGRHDTGWLVEHQVDLLLFAQNLAIVVYRIFGERHPMLRVPDDPAINLDAAGPDFQKRFRSGEHPSLGEGTTKRHSIFRSGGDPRLQAVVAFFQATLPVSWWWRPEDRLPFAIRLLC
jgi:hypothetical protein